MKGLFIFLLIAFIPLFDAFAGTVTISRSFARIREKPSSAAKPIDLAYGNDVFTVLGKKDGWYQIRTKQDRVGWVAENHVIAGEEGRAFLRPQTKTLVSAKMFQRLGYRSQARIKLREIMRFYPDTYEYYEAVRHMLFYYKIGNLPRPQGTEIDSDLMEKANKYAFQMLGMEARALIREQRYLEAVAIYEEIQGRDRSHQPSLRGMFEALTKFMKQTRIDPGHKDLGLAVSTFQKYFPTQPLPDVIQEMIRGKKWQPLPPIRNPPQ